MSNARKLKKEWMSVKKWSRSKISFFLGSSPEPSLIWCCLWNLSQELLNLLLKCRVNWMDGAWSQLEEGCIRLRQLLCKSVPKGQVNIGSIHPKMKQEPGINVQLFHRFFIINVKLDRQQCNAQQITVWMDNTIRLFGPIDHILIILFFYLGIDGLIKEKWIWCVLHTIDKLFLGMISYSILDYISNFRIRLLLTLSNSTVREH